MRLQQVAGLFDTDSCGRVKTLQFMAWYRCVRATGTLGALLAPRIPAMAGFVETARAVQYEPERWHLVIIKNLAQQESYNGQAEKYTADTANRPE
jgi:hypothetical protein